MFSINKSLIVTLFHSKVKFLQFKQYIFFTFYISSFCITLIQIWPIGLDNSHTCLERKKALKIMLNSYSFQVFLVEIMRQKVVVHQNSL